MRGRKRFIHCTGAMNPNPFRVDGGPIVSSLQEIPRIDRVERSRSRAGTANEEDIEQMAQMAQFEDFVLDSEDGGLAGLLDPFTSTIFSDPVDAEDGCVRSASPPPARSRHDALVLIAPVRCPSGPTVALKHSHPLRLRVSFWQAHV